MRNPAQSIAPARPAEHARDLQAKLYRDIGISAVAAALRFTTQPEPASRAADEPAPLKVSYPRQTLAA